MGGEVEVGVAGVLWDEAVGQDVGDGEELAEGAADFVGGLLGMAFAWGRDERDGGGVGWDFEMADALLVDGDDGFDGAALELGAEGGVAHGLAGAAVQHVDGKDGSGLWGGLGDAGCAEDAGCVEKEQSEGNGRGGASGRLLEC